MTKNIEKLITLEREISSIYSFFCQWETYGKKDPITSQVYLKVLDSKTKEEEELINTLTNKELFILNNQDNLSKLLQGTTSKYDIKKRINKRILYRELQTLTTNEKQIDDKSKIAINAVFSEAEDIYLSFLDEEIDKAKDINKIILIEQKYNYIYGLEHNSEQKLIARKFYTDNSIYLFSKMYAQANNIRNDEYCEYKEKVSSIMFNDALEINKRFNNETNENNPYRIITLSILRSCLLLSKETRTYQETLKKINTNFFQNNNEITTFIEETKKDTERHKVLSLIPKKPRN